MARIRAEVQYTMATEPGHNVHSDVDFELTDPKDREFIKTAFQEWLDNSHGSGYFYVGNIQEV